MVKQLKESQVECIVADKVCAILFYHLTPRETQTEVKVRETCSGPAGRIATGKKKGFVRRPVGFVACLN